MPHSFPHSPYFSPFPFLALFILLESHAGSLVPLPLTPGGAAGAVWNYLS